MEGDQCRRKRQELESPALVILAHSVMGFKCYLYFLEQEHMYAMRSHISHSNTHWPLSALNRHCYKSDGILVMAAPLDQ